jgi:alcohol dehydrogenase class IV
MATDPPLPAIQPAPFTWRDGDRVIRFGRDALDDPSELLGTGFTLLTTEQAAARAPQVVAAAASRHDVPPGRVDEVAADMRDRVSGELLVALGGGRVVDVAKALAAAAPPTRVAAIPTTLSGADMTWLHRMIPGVPPGTAHVRPSIVLHDPALSTSQPVADLAASAMNALAHALEAPLTRSANPVATLAAHAGARMLVGALRHIDGDAVSEAAADELALGALLAGYAVDSAGYGLHHVAGQSVVRVARIPHGPAYAALLPHTLAALAPRAPEAMAALATTLGDEPARVMAELQPATGGRGLADLGASPADLDEATQVAAARAELHNTPPAADATELRAIYEAAR